MRGTGYVAGWHRRRMAFFSAVCVQRPRWRLPAWLSAAWLHAHVAGYWLWRNGPTAAACLPLFWKKLKAESYYNEAILEKIWKPDVKLPLNAYLLFTFWNSSIENMATVSSGYLMPFSCLYDITRNENDLRRSLPMKAPAEAATYKALSATCREEALRLKPTPAAQLEGEEAAGVASVKPMKRKHLASMKALLKWREVSSDWNDAVKSSRESCEEMTLKYTLSWLWPEMKKRNDLLSLWRKYQRNMLKSGRKK